MKSIPKRYTKGLTPKQIAFAIYWVDSFNGTESARNAGYNGSDNTLAVIAHENLRKPKLKPLLSYLFEQKIKPREEILARLSLLAEGEKYGGKDVDPRVARLALQDLGKFHKIFIERILVNWRFEVQAKGMNDSEIFEEMVNYFAEKISKET